MVRYCEKTKHKVFISYYHHDDQRYKDFIDKYLSSNIINKSVMAGEYDSDNSDEYIKRLIREEKISDSSVIVVLIGPNTKNRKHVDWEIYAGLRDSVNGCSGLVGILLPTFKDSFVNVSNIPARFYDNFKSGYAELYRWEAAIRSFDIIIQRTFDNRVLCKEKKDNSRLQMDKNLGESCNYGHNKFLY